MESVRKRQTWPTWGQVGPGISHGELQGPKFHGLKAGYIYREGQHKWVLTQLYFIPSCAFFGECAQYLPQQYLHIVPPAYAPTAEVRRRYGGGTRGYADRRYAGGTPEVRRRYAGGTREVRGRYAGGTVGVWGGGTAEVRRRYCVHSAKNTQDGMKYN